MLTSGMFKKAASKAAAEGETGSVPISPTRPKRAKTRSFPQGYVEDFDKARTTLGEGVSRHAGGGRVQYGLFQHSVRASCYHAPMLIDTHTHLDDARYNDDRDTMIARAQGAGVSTFITIGCDLVTSRSAVELAGRHPFVYASVGVHPHEVKHIADDWYDELRRLAQHDKVVAYGEIGLDYHYNHSPPTLQRERFREQVCLARELNLPIVIHTREAQEDTMAILKEERAVDIGGVFHCFSGDAWLAKEALELGFFLSFSGVITFQNATMLRDIVKTVPLDRILIETDCPYLTPVPHRGKRNEPAHVRFVAKKIAELKAVSVEEIENMTTRNARRIFKIL